MKNSIFFLLILGFSAIVLFSSPVFSADDHSPANPLPSSWTPDLKITNLLASDPALFKSKLETSMRKLLQNPSSLSIELTPFNDTESSMGHYQKITLKVVRGEYDKLVLDKADTEFLDVQLDTTKLVNEEKINTVKVKTVNMDVIILENDMNAFLNAKTDLISVKNPQIKMKKDHLVLSGNAKYSFMKVKFWATGSLKVEGAKSIWFHPGKIKMNGLPLPRAFIGTLTKSINPVLNLEKFPFQINLQDIHIENGSLHFSSKQLNN
ncbi:MAG: DUF2993 domain-containing protein [Candidatus Riflebacteria bacterium]|nr:DUF2993 domain-containing protein [Candidatus Riflebacteria bacterium]